MSEKRQGRYQNDKTREQGDDELAELFQRALEEEVDEQPKPKAATKSTASAPAAPSTRPKATRPAGKPSASQVYPAAEPMAPMAKESTTGSSGPPKAAKATGSRTGEIQRPTASSSSSASASSRPATAKPSGPAPGTTTKSGPSPAAKEAASSSSSSRPAPSKSTVSGLHKSQLTPVAPSVPPPAAAIPKSQTTPAKASAPAPSKSTQSQIKELSQLSSKSGIEPLPIRGSVPPRSATAPKPSDPGDSRTSSPPGPPRRNSLSAADIRGGVPKVDTAPPAIGDDGEPSIDHKGRVRAPLYKRRTARPVPAAWKPSWGLNLLLGLWPGARLMATSEVANGMAFSMVAALVVAPAVFVFAGWRGELHTIRALGIDEKWMLAFALIGVTSVTMFEVLRLVSGVTEDRRASVPRIAATLLLPCVTAVVLGPLIVRFSTALETVWFIALGLAIIALVATALCLARDPEETSAAPQKKFVWIGGAVLLVLVGVMFGTGAASSDTLRMLATMSRDAGFSTLPKILSSISGSG